MGAGALLGIALLPMTGLKLPAGADSMPLCVWALGADGTPVYANRSWLEYAGADAGAASDAGP